MIKKNSKLNRRNFLKVAGASAGAAALVACGASSEPAAESGVDAPAVVSSVGSTANVTLWSSYSGKNGEAETELVKRFNESQSEVFIDYQFQGNYEETAAKTTAAVQSNTAPAVVLLSDVWWFKFYLAQLLAPLDGLMENAGIDVADYQDSLINEGVRQGQTWWIPFARSTPLFYYNKDKWAAAGLPDRGPETWDEFAEWAPSLTEGDTMPFTHPDGASYIAWLFQGVAWQFGGQYSDPDFNMFMTDSKTVAAGQFYYDSVHGPNPWAKPSSDIGQEFLNGFAAAAMMSTGSMGGLRENAQFEFGTALLPEKDFFGCCTGGAGLGILASASDEEKEAAMRYVAFATSPENTTFWAQNTGYMPVRKSALESDAMQTYFGEFPQFETATLQLPLTRAQDSARVWVPNGDQIIGEGLERITVQGEDVETVFAEVQEILEAEAAPVVETLKSIES